MSCSDFQSMGLYSVEGQGLGNFPGDGLGRPCGAGAFEGDQDLAVQVLTLAK